MVLDKLYKEDGGRLREWQIITRPASGNNWEIITKHGLVDGTTTTTAPSLITAGKQGRTIREQANAEARSKWLSKMDMGYVLTQADALNQVVIRPMLPKNYNDTRNGTKWCEWPMIGQRKFDGARGVASRPTPDQVVLMSRKGKLWDGMNAVREQIIAINLPSNIILDGEVYHSDVNKEDGIDFETANGLMRKKVKNYTATDLENLEGMGFYVYDLIMLDDTGNPTDMTYANRYRLIVELLSQVPAEDRPNLRYVENFRINSPAEVETTHAALTEQGFEGMMLRNINSPYKLGPTRSSNLLKVKAFQDDEFKIVGYTEGQGDYAGTPVWILELNDDSGRTFTASPMGNRSTREQMWADRDELVGKMATVKFFEYTNSGSLRHPNVKAIRDTEQ
tara:strand:- start:282 stop:1460 length:1179 start_codon:yes stop_codon:yes gene_type:complete